MVFFIWFSIEIPGAPFWGSEAQSYWVSFLGSTIRITIASWISFLITENLDALLFAKLKKITKGKNLWIRNVFSDIPTLALDSILFVSIAFGGVLPLDIVLGIIWGQMLTKWFFGIIDTPFMYLSRGIVNGKINILGNLFGKEKNEIVK